MLLLPCSILRFGLFPQSFFVGSSVPPALTNGCRPLWATPAGGVTTPHTAHQPDSHLFACGASRASRRAATLKHFDPIRLLVCPKRSPPLQLQHERDLRRQSEETTSGLREQVASRCVHRCTYMCVCENIRCNIRKYVCDQSADIRTYIRRHDLVDKDAFWYRYRLVASVARRE